MGVRWQVTVDDGQDVVKEIHTVVVHRFQMGDVDDPDLYAAQPLWEWQHSPAGEFVMKNAIETPIWKRQHDPMNWGYTFVVIARIEKKKLAEYYLKFDSPAL